MKKVQFNETTAVTAAKLTGMTQKEIAKQCGISYMTFSSVLHGRSTREEVAQKIADALGVTIEQLQKPIVI